MAVTVRSTDAGEGKIRVRVEGDSLAEVQSCLALVPGQGMIRVRFTLEGHVHGPSVAEAVFAPQDLVPTAPDLLDRALALTGTIRTRLHEARAALAKFEIMPVTSGHDSLQRRFQLERLRGGVEMLERLVQADLG